MNTKLTTMTKAFAATAVLLFCGGVLADSSYPSTSLYQLDAALVDQSGTQHKIGVHSGHPVLVTMFYGSCRHTCPLLIETLRAIERTAPNADDLRVLMISIDPEHDTPDALAKIAKERRIDTSRWTLASADASTVRKIAAALNVQYKATPDGGFNHSSVISVLNDRGEITKQTTLLGKADPDIVAALSARR